MATVLVTGASGFLGSRLAERLQEVGFEVRTFGRSPSAPAKLEKLGIKHLQGDISEPESISRALAGVGAVFHLAGLVSYRRCDYDLLYRTNVLGTRNVMKACLDAGIERVINMGSIAGMGVPAPGTIGDESIEYNLKGHGLHYCDTKYEAEQEAMRFAKSGLNVLSLNPGITFGEGDTHPHHHTIFRIMMSGFFLGYPAGGVMFSDIEDVVDACLSSLVRGEAGQRYVLGSANLSFQDAAAALAKVLGGKTPTFKIPGFLTEACGIACESIFP
ncbi:MAG: SDR family NAD(P)-dependent oxidoreductase, partial [Candidatus Obscuribacterales bacterium]|nr:SDR family NAD(P)-dependent oxidoreductase [Candidatus Obscuribacterales bacterium]